MPQCYAVGGLVNVDQGSIKGRGVPPARLKGQLGQQYFDISVTPPVGYIFNGMSWTASAASLLLTAWSETTSGIGLLSTNAEAIAGTNDNTAMTPRKVAVALLAGLPISGGPGAFTTLAVSGLASLNKSATILTAGTALNLATDIDTAAVNIGTSASTRAITIGNFTGATGVSIHVGTGNFALNGVASSNYSIGAATTTGTFNIGGTGANTGTATIFGGTGAQTINIANATGKKTVAIATGAAANAVTIGSTNTTASTTINSGSGNVNIVGGNLKILTTGKGLQIKSGLVTDMAGVKNLVLGTGTVANTNIATGDLIFLSRVASNGSAALGVLSYVINNGVGFTINSLDPSLPATVQAADMSSVSYFIVRPV